MSCREWDFSEFDIVLNLEGYSSDLPCTHLKVNRDGTGETVGPYVASIHGWGGLLQSLMNKSIDKRRLHARCYAMRPGHPSTEVRGYVISWYIPNSASATVPFLLTEEQTKFYTVPSAVWNHYRHSLSGKSV